MQTVIVRLDRTISAVGDPRVKPEDDANSR